MRDFINIVENGPDTSSGPDTTDADVLLEAGGLKKVAAGLGAAALLAGASAGAHAVGKMHGEERNQYWTGEGDPHQWGEGDWFGELDPEDEARMAPKEQRRPFSFLGRKAPKQELVAPISIPSDELNHLAGTMWGEARSEGEIGMRAVGHVVMNRIKMNRTKWGTTVRSVVRSDKQFSCWNKGDPNRKKIARMLEIDRHIASRPDDLDEWMTDFQKTSEYQEYRVWRKAKTLARAILEGRDRDITGGADHYHTTAVKPFWVPSMTKLGKIGNHLFYTAKKTVKESDEGHQEMGCTCHFGEEAEIDENAAKNMGYDLQAKYNLFNGMYFENRLPKIPLKWGSLKTKSGEVKWHVKPGDGVPERARGRGIRRNFSGYVFVPGTMTMTISSNYLRDEKSLDGILLHEMIHVWMVAVENRIEENHGPNFERMRREISAKSGIDLPLTDAVRDPIINPDIKIKEIVVMLWTYEDGEQSFAILNKTALLNNKFPDLLVDIASYAKSRKSNVKFYLVKDIAWSGLLLNGMREQRKLSSLYRMKPNQKDVLMKALENSTLLADVPPK